MRQKVECDSVRERKGVARAKKRLQCPHHSKWRAERNVGHVDRRRVPGVSLSVVPVVHLERVRAGIVREVLNVDEGGIPPNHRVRFTGDGNVDDFREVPGQSDEGPGLALRLLGFR